jgi:DNA-binding MarR family transcriptional regulator
MIKETLNEREFELINIIGTELGNSQRVLSRQLNLSLGMTNILIKRLITKGYIRIKQLNKRKVEYFLTPKGFAEKMQKSLKYTRKTLESIQFIKEALKGILREYYEQGVRKFYLVGKSDIHLLVEMVLSKEGFADVELYYLEHFPEGVVDGLVLSSVEKQMQSVGENFNHVNLVETLARKMV